MAVPSTTGCALSGNMNTFIPAIPISLRIRTNTRALASGVRGRMPAEMNAARDAKIARNDPSHTNTDRRHADDATLTNTWQQQNAQSSAGNACWTARILSMSAEHQILERQDQRLEPQNQCMHKRKRVHDMESEGPKKPVSLATIVSWLLE